MTLVEVSRAGLLINVDESKTPGGLVRIKTYNYIRIQVLKGRMIEFGTNLESIEARQDILKNLQSSDRAQRK